LTQPDNTACAQTEYVDLTAMARPALSALLPRVSRDGHCKLAGSAQSAGVTEKAPNHAISPRRADESAGDCNVVSGMILR